MSGGEPNQQVVAWGAALVGRGATITREGAGWDHVAWRITGTDGQPWILRTVIDGDDTDLPAYVRREVAVMQLARTVLGELVADAVVIDEASGAMAYPRLAGVSLQELLVAGDVPAGQLERLAAEIGGIVGALGRLDPAAVTEPLPVDDGLPAWFAELPEHVATIEPLLDAGERAAIDRFLTTAPPSAVRTDELLLTHNDLGAEHVLVDPASRSITGVIDWSDAARADQAAEVGRLLRDLGTDHLGAVLDGMGAAGAGREALVERGWCYARCLVLEDLAYALEHRPDLVAFELASLRRLFGPVVSTARTIG